MSNLNLAPQSSCSFLLLTPYPVFHSAVPCQFSVPREFPLMVKLSTTVAPGAASLRQNLRASLICLWYVAVDILVCSYQDLEPHQNSKSPYSNFIVQ